MQRLRRGAAILAEHGGDDGLELAAAIGVYTAGRGAVRLDEALGLKPGPGSTSWWRAEAIETRGQLTRQLAALLCMRQSASASEQAATGGKLIASFMARRRRNERDGVPAAAASAAVLGALRGSPPALLEALARLDVPITDRTIRSDLAGSSDSEPPIFDVNHLVDGSGR